VSGGIASNSNTTGTLIVTGGAGITGNLYSGNVYITGTSNGITFADGTVQRTAGSSVANTILIQGVDVGQNARMTIIEGVDSGQNSRMTISDGVNASQNVRLDYSNTAITIIQGTDTSQNARMVIIEGTDTSQNARMTIIEGVNASQNVRLDFSNTKTDFGIIKVSGQPDVIANVHEAQLTLVAGSNMTISTNGVSNTITFSSTGGGGGGPTTAFSRVIISGQPDAIANIANSPLTLVAGSGITLATNGVANSITITSTGGGGGSSSGYLANSVIIANSSGYLSNTANLLFFSANNSLFIYGGAASSNTTTGALVVSGGVGISGALNATTKSFNIPHPTKEGKNLRYGSLEGPEFGVYVRGLLQNSNVIELPEYWTKLVNPNSITVTLTPFGNYQKLYVKEIKDNCIYIVNDGIFGKGINCYYTVYAERADTGKLVVED
jgi:hypothetical protein